jgi:hypothetical protein
MSGTWCTLLMAVMLPLGIWVPQSAAADPIRIMPFGDDFTMGRLGHVSYRYQLWFMLQNAGFDVDFVGRKLAVREPPNLDWYPEYFTTFDREHEGRDHMVSTLMISTADSAAETFRPHVVLLMAGGRDVWDFGEAGISVARTNIPQIVQSFRSHVPNVIILLATNPAWIGDPEEGTHGAEFLGGLADAVGEMALELDTPESPVYLIDNFTGFNTSTMLGPEDLLQPNPTGEGWMADNFFDVLEVVLPTIDPGSSGGFSINAGLNDAWYNPETPGQGFFLSVFPDIEKIFLAWFTYDSERPGAGVEAVLGEPGHRWLTAFGDYAGNVAELDVELTAGGVFNRAAPVPDQQAGYGEILIEFEDCNSAVLTYDLIDAELSGMVAIQRIANDNVATCEALSQPAAN